MRIDLNKYAINRSFIQDFYRNNKDYYPEAGNAAAICSSTTHCPLIALLFYLAEDIGYTLELTQHIDVLIKFYGYTEILGQKEGSPYLERFGLI